MNENRAILLTGAGVSAIAVVRLAGPRTTDFLQRHFSGAVREGRCVHGELRDDESIIDDPVIVLGPEGGYADLNLHGGSWVVHRALDLAGQSGFEIVSSDPEPARATGGSSAAPESVPTPLWAVEGESIIEREMLAHLPLATTELGLRVLLNQPAAWGRLARELVGDRHSPGEAERRRQRARQVLADDALGHLLHPPRVAMIGIPNAGKSTLSNQLFAQERSITADWPGTTRDWVGAPANIEGLPIELMDTPGIAETLDPIERLAIEQSIREVESANLVVLVLDATQPMEPGQAALIAAHPTALRVINKSDKPAVWDAIGSDAIQTVATTGAGVDALRQAIAARFKCHDVDPTVPRWWTRRQREWLESISATTSATAGSSSI